MATLRVTLSERAATVAATRAAEGGFGSVDAYVSSLVESDVAIPISAALEAELLAGLDSGDPVQLSSIDWEAERRAAVAPSELAERK